MKSISIILFALCVFCPFVSHGQDTPLQPQFSTERDSAYFNTFNTLKDLFVKQILSARYQQTRQLIQSYKSKLRSSGYFKAADLAKDPGGLKWLKENWAKTGFARYEEAVKEYNNLLATSNADNKENKEHIEFDSFNFTAMLKYGPQIFVDVVKEVMIEYPDKI